MADETTYALFISCLPRFERLLDEELDALGIDTKRKRSHGGVEVRVNREQLWLLAHDLRCAESMRVRIASFKAFDFPSLQERLDRVAWSAWLPVGSSPEVHVTTDRSDLYHSGAVEERVRAALMRRQAGLSQSPPPAPDVLVRVVKNVVVVSVDASGEKLYRRGVRTHVGPAPLRETQAAACLRAAEASEHDTLFDPFCGSGVFLIERALMQPGLVLPRVFAFESWSSHDAEAYAQWKDARGAGDALSALNLMCCDRSGKALEAARANWQQLPLKGEATWKQSGFSEAVAGCPPGALVVTNPPWGKRLEQSRALARAIGSWLKSKPEIAGFYMLLGDRRFAAYTEQRFDEVLSFRDGGHPASLMRWQPR